MRLKSLAAGGLLCSSMFANALPVGYDAAYYGDLPIVFDMNIYGEVLHNRFNGASTGFTVNDGDAFSGRAETVTVSGSSYPDGTARTYSIYGNYTGRLNDFGLVLTDGTNSQPDSGAAFLGFTSTSESNYGSNAPGSSLAGYSSSNYTLSEVDLNNAGVGASAMTGNVLVRLRSNTNPEVLIPTVTVGSAAYNAGAVAVQGRYVDINDNGDILFVGQSAADGYGLYKYSDSAGIEYIVGTSTSTSSLASVPQQFALNNDGKVVFIEAGRVYEADGSGGKSIVGDVVNTSYISMNNAGTVAVFAGSSTDAAVSIVSPSGTVTELVETGGTLDGDTVLAMGCTNCYRNTGGVFLNDAGQVSVRIQLNDGAVSRWDQVVLNPEGTTDENPILPTPGSGPGWGFNDIPEFCTATADVLERARRRVCYLDPDYATGYNYETGGDAFLFTGVQIDSVYGDGVFDLFLWDVLLGDYINSGHDVTTGMYFDFISLGAINGISRFSLRGIEESAAIDPLDPLGFVTGLSFWGDSSLGFTMTPLTGDGPALGVPTPNTIYLLGLGLVLGYLRCLQRA